MTSALSARAAAVRRTLSERDLAVLSSLFRVRLMTVGQIQRLHLISGSPLTQLRRTRNTLQHLHDLQLVVRLPRVIGGVRAGSSGYIYGLSGLGQAVLDLPGTFGRRRRSVWDTKPYFEDHVLGVTELYVRLVETCRERTADLLAFDAEPACWRRFIGAGGEPVTLKPDAYVRVGAGEIERSAFVEVDLATESPATLRRKCLAFVAYWRTDLEQQHRGVFPTVLWLVPDEQRRQRLADVVQHLAHDVQQLFHVALLSDGPALLTAPEGGDR